MSSKLTAFLRLRSRKNCSLLETDSVQGQISEHTPPPLPSKWNLLFIYPTRHTHLRARLYIEKNISEKGDIPWYTTRECCKTFIPYHIKYSGQHNQCSTR